jgi:hypothetical protein
MLPCEQQLLIELAINSGDFYVMFQRENHFINKRIQKPRRLNMKCIPAVNSVNKTNRNRYNSQSWKFHVKFFIANWNSYCCSSCTFSVLDLVIFMSTNLSLDKLYLPIINSRWMCIRGGCDLFLSCWINWLNFIFFPVRKITWLFRHSNLNDVVYFNLIKKLRIENGCIQFSITT